jgi:hypothetical protein
MHLTICFYVLLVAAGWLNSPEAAAMTDEGDWSRSLCRFVLAPLASFLLLHAGIYYGVERARGPSKLKSVYETRLVYISFALALMGLLGTLADRANPTL